MSIIDNVTGISISSDFFSETKKFEFFPIHNKQNKKNRIALIYGRNGSGKSTIAKGFYDYSHSINPRNIVINLLDNNNQVYISPDERANKVFVFDEDYISKNVKMKNNGLDTIVLLGEQIDLEEQIKNNQNEIDATKSNLEKTEKELVILNDAKSKLSPKYWESKIIKHLQNNWAETDGLTIKQKRKRSTVNTAVINQITSLNITHTKEELQKDFKEKLVLFETTNSNSKTIHDKVLKLPFDHDIENKSIQFLKKTVSKPHLTSREQELLNVFGIGGLLSSKDTISNNENSLCPTCFRVIDTDYYNKILEEIDHIISKEFENFKNDLNKLLIESINIESFRKFEVIDKRLFSDVVLKITDLNSSIEKHNLLINKKISLPYEVIDYGYNELLSLFNKVNEMLNELENKRIEYNNALNDRDKLKDNLIKINNEIAHFEIWDDYQEYQKALTEKKTKEQEHSSIKEKLENLTKQKEALNSQKKNLKLAADKLNEELEYIFFSKKRLSLSVDNQNKSYTLKVNNQHVSPEQVSSGERNALALCYFFADISKNMDIQNMYSNEILLVIDDPISSFDFENKIGILSYLKFKLQQILSGCATTKVIIMTHDASVVVDLEKALSEISKYCSSIYKPSEYKLFSLYNKQISNFSLKKYNEYSELLKSIFNFAIAESISDDLNIGNQIRRVFEAFSTFSFKKGSAEISTSTEILNLLPSAKSKDYFENLMYRLVLNGESHMEHTARFYPQSEFYSHLSPEEKQRTAKDVLCFMYILNPQHVISHLSNEATEFLESWKNEIVNN